MKNTIRPIKDAIGRVVDFVVEYDCEACKKRRQKIKRVLKSTRDRLRQPRRK